MVAPPNGEIPVKLKRAPHAFLNKRNADAWIVKHNKNWKAVEQDINGDGVKDLVILDEKETPIIINGWTLARDDYPYRQKYYSIDPQERAKKSFSKWIQGDYFNVSRDPNREWLYKYEPSSQEKLHELETYRNANYSFPSGFVKQDSPFKVFSEAFAIPLTNLYNNIIHSVFDRGPVQATVMAKIFPKNKVLKNFYDFIVGSFIIFYKHRHNIVGLVQNALEVKHMPADFGKALYRSLSHGVNPIKVLKELKLVQNQRDEWRMSDPEDNVNPQTFIDTVMKVLLYENTYLHRIFLIRSIQDINMFLLGGRRIVSELLNIIHTHDLYEPILANTEEGKNAISRLKKDIEISWKNGISNWGKMLYVLINPSTAKTFLGLFNDVANKDQILQELDILDQTEEQKQQDLLQIEELT